MTERERLMKRISSYDFAVIELHIYLDTHPMIRRLQISLPIIMPRAMPLERNMKKNSDLFRQKEIMPTVGRGFQIRGHGITTRRVISYVGLREKA